MIGIYEVYIDVYFVENALLDMLVLLSMAVLLGIRPSFMRILAASLLGGAGAVLILLFGLRYGAGYILCVAALDLAMCLLTFSSLGSCLIQTVYFQGLSFVYMKLYGCVSALVSARFAGLLSSALLAAAAAAVYLRNRCLQKRRLYSVQLIEGKSRLDLKALLDTGNALVDPYNGRPVAIVEENETLLGWLRKKPEKYRIIPFHSIGEENGILEGTTVDALVIRKDDGQCVEKDAVIAIYPGKLSADGSYRMLLNRSSAG